MHEHLYPTPADPSLIFQMRMLAPEDLKPEAAEKLVSASRGLRVIDERRDGLFDSFLVGSGTAVYEVDTLGLWYRCTCEAFRFGRLCKHVTVCIPRVCRSCMEKSVTKWGDECRTCEHDNAPYLPPTAAARKPTMIGRIRV